MGHRSAPSSKVSVALERTRAPIVLGQMLGRPENGRPYGRYDRIGNGRAYGESVFGAAISGGPRTAAPTGGTTASGTAAPAGNPYLAPQSRAARERPPLRVVRPHRVPAAPMGDKTAPRTAAPAGNLFRYALV